MIASVELFLTLPPLLFLILERMPRRCDDDERSRKAKRGESSSNPAKYSPVRVTIGRVFPFLERYSSNISSPSPSPARTTLYPSFTRRRAVCSSSAAVEQSTQARVCLDSYDAISSSSLCVFPSYAGMWRLGKSALIPSALRRKVSVMTVGTFTERRSISDISFM